MTIIQLNEVSPNGKLIFKDEQKITQNNFINLDNKIGKPSLIPINQNLKLAIQKIKSNQNSYNPTNNHKSSSSSLSNHLSVTQESNEKDRHKRSDTIMSHIEVIADSKFSNRENFKTQGNLINNLSKKGPKIIQLQGETSSPVNFFPKKKLNFRSETIVLSTNNEKNSKIEKNKILDPNKLNNKNNKALNFKVDNIAFNSKTYEKIATSSSSVSSILSLPLAIDLIDKPANVFDLINHLKKKLNKIEKSFSLNNLFNSIVSNLKHYNYRLVSIKSLRQFCKKSSSQSNLKKDYNLNSLPISQSQISRTSPVRSTSKQKIAVSQKNDDPNNIKPIQRLFRHLSLFQSLLLIIERDLIDDILKARRSVLSNRTSPVKNFAIPPNEKRNHLITPRRSITNLGHVSTYYKYESFRKSYRINDNHFYEEFTDEQIKLKSFQEQISHLNEKISLLINESNITDLNLLSKYSALPSKFESFKCFEFVLRLTTDIIYKMNSLLDICQKIYHLRTKTSDIKNHKIKFELKETNKNHTCESESYEEFHHKEDAIAMKNIVNKKNNCLKKLPKLFSEPTELCDDKEDKTKLNNLNISEPSSPQVKYCDLIKQDSNDSFIRETDSSSIMSDDDSNENVKDEQTNISRESKTSPKLNGLMEIKSNDIKYELFLPEINFAQDRDKLIEKYYILQNQLNLSNNELRNLNIYMERLIQRAERYAFLKMQLKSDLEIIKNAENVLIKYSEDKNKLKNQEYIIQLENELDFLRFRLKNNLKDFNIEKVCAPELHQSIGNIEYEISEINDYIKNLTKNLIYIESKLSQQNKKENSQRKSSMPFTLPPINNVPDSYDYQLKLSQNHIKTKDFYLYK